MRLRQSFYASTLLVFFAQSVASAMEPINLKVLYAGNPGSDRTKDFKEFLERYFTSVAVVDFRQFEEAQAADHDVVIFDWTTIYARDAEGKILQDQNGITMPPAPQLSRDFDRATILIGAAGGQVAGRLDLKINWL